MPENGPPPLLPPAATSLIVSPAAKDLSHQIRQILQTIHTPESQPLSIGLKLTNQNYMLWSRLMQTAIGRKGKLHHLTEGPPTNPDADWTRWEQAYLNICTGILLSIDLNLMDSFAAYSTAKELWVGLATTFASGGDDLQLFDLTVKASRQTQGLGSVEELYSTLQRLWQEIDRRQPNPMKCSHDIEVFNRLRQEQRLFQFLTGINTEYDAVKRDLLKMEPLPVVEATYAAIRREASRLVIMNPERSLSAEHTLGPGHNGTINGQVIIWWEKFRQKQLNHTRGSLVQIMWSRDILISNKRYVILPFGLYIHMTARM